MGDIGFESLEGNIPKKGWGYSVMRRTFDDFFPYEVCPFYNGQIPLGMDVYMCRDVVDVGKAIEEIMAGKAPRFDVGDEEE